MGKILAFALALISVCLIAAAVVWGTSLPNFALWKLFCITGPFVAFILYLFYFPNPLERILSIVIILLPAMGVLIPPARISISLFDSLMLLGIIFLAVETMNGTLRLPGLPLPALMVLSLLLFPSLLLSINITHSVVTCINVMPLYIFSICISLYLVVPGWTDRMHSMLMVGLFLTAVAVIFERVSGVNLSGSSLNLNAIAKDSHLVFRRAGGFFQDPQKAGQFLACLITYFSILWSRHFFKKRIVNILLIGILFLSSVALLLTVSRNAIVSCFAVTSLGVLLFNRFDYLLKIALACLLVMVIALFLYIPSSGLVDTLLPRGVLARFSSVDKGAAVRLGIWQSSWRIFHSSLLVGVGPGNYQEEMIRKEPYLRNSSGDRGYVPTQPENGYLKILYETGVLGIIGMLYLLALFVKHALKAIRELSLRTEAIAASLTVLVFLTTFSTLFTVSNDSNALIPVLMMALVCSPRSPAGPRTDVEAETVASSSISGISAPRVMQLP